MIQRSLDLAIPLVVSGGGSHWMKTRNGWGMGDDGGWKDVGHVAPENHPLVEMTGLKISQYLAYVMEQLLVIW